MYEQETEYFTDRAKPFMIPALIVAGLPTNQARHILRSYGYDKFLIQTFLKFCQEGQHITGNVTNIINIMSAISY